jgi:hypothetical protein
MGPATNKSDGFYDFLVDRVHCTPPQSFDEAAAACDETLFTEEAADLRQAAAGRDMIEWEGSLQHNQHPSGAWSAGSIVPSWRSRARRGESGPLIHVMACLCKRKGGSSYYIGHGGHCITGAT